MSAVSGAGAGQSQLLQFLQSQGTSGFPGGGQAGGIGQFREQFSSAVSQAASDAGLTAEQTDQLKSDLGDAFKSAIQSGNGPGAAREEIKGILENAGIDPASVRDALPGGGFGGVRPSFGGFQNAANPSSTQQELLGELLDSLDSGESGESDELAERLSGYPIGSFYDLRG